MANLEIGAKLKLDASQASESLGNIKKSLKEAKDALNMSQQAFGEFSAEAVQAAKRVAELQDRLGDTRSLVDAFNPDEKFRAFGNSLQGVVGGFTAVQGVMGLVSSESEEVQKMLLKVQSAMAISDGLNAVMNSVQAFKNLGVVIKSSTVFMGAYNMATTAAAAIQRLFTGAVATTTVGFNALRTAIISTGIGALVVGIGILISKISDWTSGTDDAEAAQNRLKNAVDALNAALDKNLAKVKFQTQQNLLLARIAGKSEKELYEIKRKGLNNEWLELQDHANRKAKLANDEIAKSKQDTDEERLRLKGLRDDAEAARTAVKQKEEEMKLAGLEFDAQVAEKSRNQAKQNSEKAKAERQKDAQEQKREREERIAAEKDLQAQLLQIMRNAALERVRGTKAQKEMELKFELEDRIAQINASKASEQAKKVLIESLQRQHLANLMKITDDHRKENEQKQKEHEAKMHADVSTSINATTDKRKEKRVERDAVKKTIEDKDKTPHQLELEQLDKEFKEKMELYKGQKDMEVALTDHYEGLKSDLEKKHAQERLNYVAGFLSKASGIFAKHTVAAKGIAVAEAIMNTYSGATQALRAPVPLPEPFATGVRIAQAGVIVASGLKSIKEITKAKVPGGSGGGASISTAGISAQTNVSPGINTQLTQLDRNTINAIGNQAVRTFLVESDVSTGQERRARLNRAARLG